MFSLIGSIKQVSDVLSTITLKILVLSDVTIADEDMPHLSYISAINSGKKYYVSCSVTSLIMVSDKDLLKQTLVMLDIVGNCQITSVSTSTITNLIQTTKSLTVLHLENTSLNDDNIRTICTSLTKNATIQELLLSSQHEDYCKKLDKNQNIKDKLKLL